MSEYKTCTKCGQTKTTDNYYKSKNSLNAACKSCHCEQSMAWQKANKERFAAYKKQWQRDNPDKIFAYVSKYRADKPEQVKKWRSDWGDNNLHKSREYRLRKKQIKTDNQIGLITARDIQRILQQPCLYCGLQASHVDHIFPLSRGGSHTIGNLAPSCSQCNLSKSTKTIMEWRVWKRRLGLSL